MSNKNSLKYYFTASTKELNDDKERYDLITSYLNSLKCVPLNYVHLDKKDPIRIEFEAKLSSNEISVYDLQTSLINRSDFLIADITKESITVGYQIDYAVRKKIPVLVLTEDKVNYRPPVMLTNNHYGLMTLKKYKSGEDIKKHIFEFINAVTTEKIKFNFFISIPVNNYVTKRAKFEGKNKSQIIRGIISQEAERNPIE